MCGIPSIFSRTISTLMVSPATNDVFPLSFFLLFFDFRYNRIASRQPNKY